MAEALMFLIFRSSRTAVAKRRAMRVVVRSIAYQAQATPSSAYGRRLSVIEVKFELLAAAGLYEIGVRRSHQLDPLGSFSRRSRSRSRAERDAATKAKAFCITSSACVMSISVTFVPYMFSFIGKVNLRRPGARRFPVSLFHGLRLK
ncbi:hypothetical protein AJ87_44450 [Rhizobium yanglingense]|nr:hypothetical protein AJ87_44450 [Rhizobium yanglingense]